MQSTVAWIFLSMDDAKLKWYFEWLSPKEWWDTARKSATFHIAVQVLCKRLWFDPGALDGIYGINESKGTRWAVKQLQLKLNELKPSPDLVTDWILWANTLNIIVGQWDKLITGVPSVLITPQNSNNGSISKSDTVTLLTKEQLEDPSTITSLTPNQAQQLAKLPKWSLFLYWLTSLDTATATALAKLPNWDLWLGWLATVDSIITKQILENKWVDVDEVEIVAPTK